MENQSNNGREYMSTKLPFATIVMLLAALSAALLALQPAQAQESILYNFCAQTSNCYDGASPFTLTPDGLGNFYGTASNGGGYGYGDLFQLTPNGAGADNETDLYDFCNDSGSNYCSFPAGPVGNLILNGDYDVFGASFYGGEVGVGPAGLGWGMAYELAPGAGPNGAWGLVLNYNFEGDSNSGPDGAFPGSGLTWGPQEQLYGTTSAGGANGAGTVYELTTQVYNGSIYWAEQVIYDFPASKGLPSALTVDGSGNLYGTTDEGGNGCGNVYELSPNGAGGWNETTLYVFKCEDKDGESPLGAPVFDSAGNLYGTTSIGGTNPDAGYGTVWKLTPNNGTWKEQILYSFKGGKDGSTPNPAVVLDSLGNVYGTALYGGTNQNGTLFELAFNGTTYTKKTLWTFLGVPNDGANPNSLILYNGNLYGTTQQGGQYYDGGTAFEYQLFGFTLSASPASFSLPPGYSASPTIESTAIGGFASTITLSATGQPPGVTVSISPSSIAPGSNATMTIDVAPLTPYGTYPITVTGTSGSTVQGTTFTLKVAPGPPIHILSNE